MKKEAPDGASFFHLNQRHALAKHVEYLCFELPGVDRLGHVAVESAREYLLFVGCEGESRHGDDRHVGRLFADLGRGFVAVHHGHVDVHEHQVRGVPVE